MRQYLRIRGALDAEQLRACNAIIDAKLAADADPQSLTHRFHSTHGGVEAISASQSESSEGPNGLLDWGPPFLGLVDNAAVLPKMVDMLSIERFGHVHPDCPPGRAHEIRLDHDYLNVMRYDGSAGGTYSESGTSQLHSAGQSALHATMVYELADVPENAGGLCADPCPSHPPSPHPTQPLSPAPCAGSGVVPGSHLAGFRLPSGARNGEDGFSNEWQKEGWRDPPYSGIPGVTTVACEAGDCIIFSEKLLHSTAP